MFWMLHLNAFLNLSALRVNSLNFVHPPLKPVIENPFSVEPQAVKEITSLGCGLRDIAGFPVLRTFKIQSI